MKLTLSILTFIFLFTSNVYSQEVPLIENTSLELCGRILFIDGFYVDNYETKVDISNYMTETSKPIIGGYKLGDTIHVTNGCRYRICTISKYAIKNPGGMEMRFGGEIMLAIKCDVTYTHHKNIFTMASGDRQKFGSLDWTVKNISMNSASIELKNDTAALNFNLEKNSIVWFGGAVYYVSNFLAQATDDPDKTWLIEFTKAKDYSYLTGEVIPGELINAPHDITLPTGTSWLIIRKMKFVPKKRVDEEELAKIPVKYWVLQVYNYHGGIARPVIEVNTGGVKRYLEFDAYKSFETEAEALEFAKLNSITDIVLEEE
jgi:hypothetical protein